MFFSPPPPPTIVFDFFNFHCWLGCQIYAVEATSLSVRHNHFYEERDQILRLGPLNEQDASNIFSPWTVTTGIQLYAEGLRPSA
jgi:hypothetical protein